MEERERKEQEEKVKALRAELLTVAERAKKEELENVEMGGFGPLSQNTMVAAGTNTEKRMYAQAAVQAQEEGKPEVTPLVSEVSSDKEKMPEMDFLALPSTSGGGPRSQAGRGTSGAMTKAVVIHGVGGSVE